MKLFTHCNTKEQSGIDFLKRLDEIEGLRWNSGDKPSGFISHTDDFLLFDERDVLMKDRVDYTRKSDIEGYEFVLNFEFFDKLKAHFDAKATPKSTSIFTHVAEGQASNFLQELDEFQGLTWTSGHKPSQFNKFTQDCFYLEYTESKKLLWKYISDIKAGDTVVNHDDFKKAIFQSYPKVKPFVATDYLDKAINFKPTSTADLQCFLKTLEARYPNLRWRSGSKPTEYPKDDETTFLTFGYNGGKYLSRYTWSDNVSNVLSPIQFIEVLDLYKELKSASKPTWYEYLKRIASIDQTAALVLATDGNAKNLYESQDKIITISGLIVFVGHPEHSSREWMSISDKVEESYKC